MARYQIVRMASDGDDVVAGPFTVYEDALLRVAEMAKQTEGFLEPADCANVWVMVQDGRKRFGLAIQKLKK